MELNGCRLGCTKENVMDNFMSEPDVCVNCGKLIKSGDIYTCKYISDMFDKKGMMNSDH